ncbi:hypothetical protein M8C21_015937, partial [Ambrosia artemisiifolia]
MEATLDLVHQIITSGSFGEVYLGTIHFNVSCMLMISINRSGSAINLIIVFTSKDAQRFTETVVMESYLNDNFEVKLKNSSEEALERWGKLCWLVTNKKRRFRFTANLSKRFEARAIQRSNL